MKPAVRRHVADDPAPGRRVGSYRLERRLGVGGMGEVWLGRHVDSGGLGAVKLAKRDGRDPSRRQAFVVREGRAVTRLRHPHIVGIFEVGDEHVVYQYVEGQDLRRRLQSPIDPASAVRITRQIAAALAHAHVHGVIHRDVKPSNILLDTQRNAFLADFGLALVDAEGVPGSSRAGTPDFMAPEQARGDLLGPAADQYALGRTLLEMLLGGTPPVDREQALAQLPGELPAALRDLCSKATAARAEDRFASMAGLEAALAGLDLGHLAPPVQLAPTLRASAPFAWLAHAECASIAPDLERADLSLLALLACGALPAEGATLLERFGYRDLAWSIYGSSARLGPLDQAAALARASEVVVMLHGFPMTRAVWKPIAEAVCRDNARAVVLTLDVFGAGGSPMREADGGGHVQLAAVPDLARDLLALLGLTALPTVLVGHSFCASALLERGDEDVGANVSRVAINPAFPELSPAYRARMRASRVALSAVLPFTPIHSLVNRFIARFSLNAAELSGEERGRMRDVGLRMGVPLIKSFVDALMAARINRSRAHERLTVIAGQNDPLVAEEVLVAAVEALGLPPSRCVRMATGGHYPHVESEQHPEWTARNQAEIVHVIGHALALTVMSPNSSGAALPHTIGDG